MHNVLDPRDVVPDEVEQLLHSGFDVEPALYSKAKDAAGRNDLAELARIAGLAATAKPRGDWAYDEPDGDDDLLPLFDALPTLPVNDEGLADRIRGAWLGRTLGNTLGKPVEGITPAEMKIYLTAAGQWPQTGFVPLVDPLPAGVDHLHESAPFASAGLFEDVPRDDDIDWTILGLHILEKYGPTFTANDVCAEWLDRLPYSQTFTAERAAYRNLIHGLSAPLTATTDNPYREWIGALIRADIFGYVNPGRPGVAAKLALVDARISHIGNGIYGETWAAAVVAAAFSTDSAREALGVALASIPNRSRLFEALSGVIRLFDDGETRDEALAWVLDNLGHYNWVHTINNAALIAVGLLWGEGFMDSVALTISGAWDTDSSAATVGSVFGALHGYDSIPQELVGTTHRVVRSAVRDFDRITIDELAERTLRIARG